MAKSEVGSRQQPSGFKPSASDRREVASVLDSAVGDARLHGASSLSSPSLVQPLVIRHAASAADSSTIPSGPIAMCRPDKVCNEPIPCGALRRTSCGGGGFNASA